MKVSRAWLQNYFDSTLPSAEDLAEKLTFHAFEIESVEGDILDVKVTPNRGHDCLSHRGIAKELSAILDIEMKREYDPFARPLDLSKKTDAVSVTIEDSKLSQRYIAGYVTGVKVGPSPDWLREALESIGQRSINNIVDATNLVMWNIGQPMHAFDAKKLKSLAMAVRHAKDGETIQSLDDKMYTLNPSMLVITAGEKPVAIAGVKGGMDSGIDENTTDIVLEAANFDGPTTRKTASALKLRTDSSAHFEQVLSPELAAYGMRQMADLVAAVSGGTLQGYVDAYPEAQTKTSISVSLEKINRVLGTSLSAAEVENVFTRLGFAFTSQASSWTVESPFERLDLAIPEDLIEEVGRIIGYDAVPSEELPKETRPVAVNLNFAAAENIREELVAEGYSEVFTSVFVEKGDRLVANKVDGVRPYLRKTLTDALKEVYEKNARNKDLLGLKEVKIFEIGTVWRDGKELLYLGKADKTGVTEFPLETKNVSGYQDLAPSAAERYASFSKYPFIVRDVALWVPKGTDAESVHQIIRGNAGDLVVRSEKFDEFEKGEKTSFAFRLIFQSFERTLTDEEANQHMENVYKALKDKGWEVR